MSAQALMLVRLAPGVRPGRGFDSPVHSRPKAKGSERSLLLLGGGAGGNRTRVRKTSMNSSTCLVG